MWTKDVKNFFVIVDKYNLTTERFKSKIELSFCSEILHSLSSIEKVLLMLWYNPGRHYGIINEGCSSVLDLSSLDNLQTLQTCRSFKQGHF